MILKDIADEIGMDISTVSRVTNGKYVQTEYGVFELKHFFSEKIKTDKGEDVSNKKIKEIIKNITKTLGGTVEESIGDKIYSVEIKIPNVWESA